MSSNINHPLAPFPIVWLDPNTDETSEEYHQLLNQWRKSCFARLIFFNDYDKCVDYLTTEIDKPALLVADNSVDDHFLCCIHNIQQIRMICLVDIQQRQLERNVKHWPKIRGIFLSVISIISLAIDVSHRFEYDASCISFARIDIDGKTINLNQIEPSFMYSQLFKEIVLEIQFSEEHIESFAEYCRTKDLLIPHQLIDKFQQEYHHQSPIWWYTSESFLYPMLNQALRTLDMETLVSMGFFIRDLHRQIKDLYEQQSVGDRPSVVYRGQGLSDADLEKLSRNQGGFLSFNNFLSTSRDRDVAATLAESNALPSHQVGILFQINIGSSRSPIPFAILDEETIFQEEEEILFSMHTICRIGPIRLLREDNTRLYYGELIVTDEDDLSLQELTNMLRAQTSGPYPWFSLGELLRSFASTASTEKNFASQSSDFV